MARQNFRDKENAGEKKGRVRGDAMKLRASRMRNTSTRHRNLRAAHRQIEMGSFKL